MDEVTTDWVIHQLLWVNGNVKANIDDGTIYEDTSEVPSASIPVFFRAYSVYSTAHIKADWVFVGKYVDPEPSVINIGEQNIIDGTLFPPVRLEVPVR